VGELSRGQTLQGRTCLITGASSGLGRHFALKASQAGARVAVTARRKDLLDNLCDEIRATGGVAEAISMDVASEESTLAGFAQAEASLGPVDSVIANAGMAIPRTAMKVTMEEFDRQYQVNFRGVFLTAREAARRMITQPEETRRSGRILLVSSVGGVNVLPGQPVYCANKAAIIMLGRSLAHEWCRHGINVNVLCPGYIETELTEKYFAREGGQALVASFPRKRLMKESDLDFIVEHLLSDASEAVTGGVHVVDDGQFLAR
jgi:NAD(P)-dependent dehydrogenase (short-subunit alcohol dehydrogenase family)